MRTTRNPRAGVLGALLALAPAAFAHGGHGGSAQLERIQSRVSGPWNCGGQDGGGLTPRNCANSAGPTSSASCDSKEVAMIEIGPSVSTSISA